MVPAGDIEGVLDTRSRPGRCRASRWSDANERRQRADDRVEDGVVAVEVAADDARLSATTAPLWGLPERPDLPRQWELRDPLFRCGGLPDQLELCRMQPERRARAVLLGWPRGPVVRGVSGLFAPQRHERLPQRPSVPVVRWQPGLSLHSVVHWLAASLAAGCGTRSCSR